MRKEHGRIIPLLFRIFFFLSILCIPRLNIYSQTAETIYKNIANSTVTIETEVGFGSGFFIAPNIIATNLHVIKGSSDAYCFSNLSNRKYKIDGYVAVDKINDLILLKVKQYNRPAIRIATKAPKIGQSIYVIGSPKGLPASISNGIISGIRYFDSIEVIQITAPISSGSSGGPVLNSEGQLVGVSYSQLKEGQNLNFAIHKNSLKNLMANISTLKELKFLYKDLNSNLKIDFPSVKIGAQEWMSKNLDVTHFRNGDYIQEAKSKEEWERASKAGIPAWCYYENDSSNQKKYGKLYNWYAVNDIRGLAPEGWEISSLNDWEKLVDFIGEENVGSEIKVPFEWIEGNGSNLVGFNAYPAGIRMAFNDFFHAGNTAYWWTKNEIDNEIAAYICLLRNAKYTTTFFIRYGKLSKNLDEINSYKGDKGWGLSVRCIKN